MRLSMVRKDYKKLWGDGDGFDDDDDDDEKYISVCKTIHGIEMHIWMPFKVWLYLKTLHYHGFCLAAQLGWI